jgi:hypothetical protein
MLRRFEMYALRAGVDDEQRATLARVLRDTGRFIPEVLDSAIGWNTGPADVELAWEHAYESPASYARYMRHPYHICILDRYLLPESPECITEGRPALQLGLMGYEIEAPRFRAARGVRRITALHLGAAPDAGAVAEVVGRLERRPEEVDGMRVSVVAPNTMGLEWFPTGWTHVWEQAYDDASAAARAVADEERLLAAPVERSLSVQYVIEAAS